MAKKTSHKKTKARKAVKLSEQVRRAIETCGVSRYRIAKDLGISQSLLSYFVSGKRGLSVDVLDALGEYLDLEVVMHGPKQP